MGKKAKNPKVADKIVQALQFLQDVHEGLDVRETVQFYRGLRKHLKTYIQMFKSERQKKRREKKRAVDSPPADG
jgi:hypothetical protein